MKRIKVKIISFLLVIGLMFTGCETVKNSNKTQRGTAVGAVGGAALGALIGGKNNRALGAIIGAAVGGVAGNVIGRKMDEQAKEIENTLPGAEVVRTEEGIQVILDEKSDVRFAFNQSNLTDASKANLHDLKVIFDKYSDTDVTVFGYTDSKGSEEYNLGLSKKRAQSVIDYLVADGMPASRLTAVGLGEAEPRATNETEEGRAANRRVEFAIVANEKMIEDAKKEAGEE